MQFILQIRKIWITSKEVIVEVLFNYQRIIGLHYQMGVHIPGSPDLEIRYLHYIGSSYVFPC